MSTKKVWLGALALTLASFTAVRAQNPYDGGPRVMPDATGAAPAVGEVRSRATLSSWIAGDPDCCGPISDRNPLRTELFVRSGVSLVGGDGALADSLTDGWLVEGGGRALFFNHLGDAAWNIDIGLTNIHNTAASVFLPIRLLNFRVSDPNVGNIIVPEQAVRVRALNRTFVNLGGGREWYLYGPAVDTRDADEPARWRVGIDGGGRWGTAKCELFELRRRTDTIAGVYAAAHTDFDFPCGAFVFVAGVRGEWSYTWSDILQIQNRSDLMDVNITVNFGIRY